ncbi:PREDICTED: protein PF14_0175-like isoform X2 [Acromyrmex echinatior]|nr:PREDICTED: protein PF14_0175-like isoform X2 [Acromyrmex echinatior]
MLNNHQKKRIFICVGEGTTTSAAVRVMAEYKEQATYMFNNFELKRWLHGDENRRRMLLVKLKNDLRKLGLSKRATRAGLVQLAMKPCVILKRLSVSCYRKKLLQSSHSNFIPIHKEKVQTNHRDDVENNRLEDNSQDIVQHTFKAQIPNTASGITLINAVNANKTCQSKIQECDLIRKESSDGTKQDFNQKVVTNISHIDVTSTNYTDIFAKKSVIEASPSFSSSEDESLNKHIQNVVHEFINKSLDTTMLFQLEEHSDSKSSIDSLKDVFRERHREKKDYEIKQEFFPVKSKLLDISREDSHKSKTDNIFENNISSSNAIISESKTYAKVKVINYVDKIQNVSTSEKSENSIEHIDTLLHQTPIKKDVNVAKMYLKSKNSQTESQPIETDSKTVIKRKIRSESLDRNISLIKKSKKNEVNVSSKKVVADSTIGSSHYEMLSDNELVHAANERNEKKNNVKIMKIRAKFHECFRGNFDTDTSESEEEREILLNLKKNKQRFDDPLHNNSITKENVEYIFERNKLIHDLSANNWQKNIENTISDKIRSDNLYDSILSDKEYALHNTVTEKQIEDSASLDKYPILTNNSQESTENINLDNLCDSSTYVEKFDVSDAIIEMPSIYKSISTSVNASQKNINSIYSDISYDSDACTEKYSPSNVTIDEEMEETLVCEHDMSDNNSQENVKDKKDAISNKVKFKNSNSSTYKEKYFTKEKNIQDEATICNYDMSTNNSQENMDVSAEIISDNSSDLSNCTEKYCATNIIVTRKEIKNKTLICTNDTLTNHVNNSQENIENAILAEAKSDNLGNSIARIKKCDITIKKKINHDESINDELIYMLPDNSQKNIESAIPLEVTDNSCNSTVNTGKYIKHNTVTDEKKDGISSIYKHSIPNDSQEHIESTIPAEINFDNSISNIEKYSTHNIIINEKTEDGASTYKCDTPVNNSQENVKSIIPIEVQFDNSCDSECEIHSTVNVEKYDSMHDTAKDKVKNRTSICERNMLDNESKNIGNIVSAEKEDIQNSSSTDMENNSKCDISAKHNIPSMIEINLDENMSIENIYLNKNIKKKADTTYKEAEEVSVQNLQKNQEMRNVESINLAQHKNMQKNANLELLIMSTFETSYNVGKKDNRDMLEKNVENLLLSNNNNMVKDEKTIDQFSMITSKLKKNSSEEKSNDSFSILPSNSSSKSNYSDNCSLNIHLSDNDNSNDIEVEIKIKPKLKSRVSRKFSLKAPWSAVSTCIKNLHTLKDNPSFLNELLQMDHRTSEKFNRKVTNTKEKKNDTSLDNVTAETDEIIHNSSPTTKDDENHSQQRNSQDRPILNEDKNMIAYDDKKEKNECTQSFIQTTPIITENNLDSSRFACDTSDLGKQSQKVVANDKQKNNEEQNFQNKTTLEGTKNVVKHNQVKEIEILFVERKKPQITTENNLESIKAADDSPDVAEPQTSSNMTHKKVRVRSIAELSYQCIEKSVNLTASIPKSVCSTFCQSVSQSTTVHSTSSQLAPQSTSRLAPQSTSFQSAPQSVFFQSAPSQSVAFQPILPQSTCPQLGHPSLVPPRFIFPQSTSQSVSKRPSPLSHNTTLKHTYLLPNTSSAVASVEVNTPNNNILKNLIQITIKNICTNIGYCRNLDQYNHVRINFPEDYVQRLSLIMQQINQDLENLKMWLNMKNIDSTLIYVNFYMPKNHPVTVPELHKYMQICYNYLHISQQNYANSSQYPNINRLLSNASMSNVDAQQFSRNASFLDTRMLNRDTFMPSSTMPCPAPTTSNINQQQLVRNSANSTQVPHSRQPRPNIHQSYMSYVPFTAQSRMPNANQQQSLENASHPIQGRYMPANILNAGVQQDFLIVNNIPSSNVNMRSREPVNQGNANVSSTTNMRQLHTLQKNTSSNTATVSATNNVQQQKQMYLQTSQINSRTAVYPSPTNQNNSFGVCQTVPGCDNINLSGSFTINPDTSRINAAMKNARHRNTNVNRQQASCSPQVSQISSGKTQYLPQYNPNQTYLIVAQSAHSNIQTHPVQNTLPNQNVWQVQQQQLAVNHGNTSIPSTINKKQPYIIRNVISNTTTEKSHRYILPKDTTTYPIDLSINDLSQNVQQNMSQQKLTVNQRNANMPPTINTKQSHMTSKNPINSTTITSQYVSKDTSIYPINLSINNTLQNVQENVLNKEGEMTESQNTNRMQKKAQSMNLRDTHQEILSVCNKLQNIDTVSENTRSSRQRLSVLQSMMSTISPNKNDAVLFLSAIERKKQRNKVMFSNNLASLTDIQKILLRDQIKSYFIMWDELKNLLSKQEFERVHNERIILFYSYVNVDDYIKSIINESQTVKKSVEKSSQNNMSQTKSTLQEGTIQTSEDKLTKTQLNQDNENNLEYNRISEKQSEQSIDSNISKSPKSAIKSNLEASNEEFESLCTSVITKKFYPKDIRSQEQDNNTLKKQFQKGSLIDTEKESRNTETLSPEEKLITEVSAKNLKTKTQDNAKIIESLKVTNSYDPSLKQNLLFNLLQDMPTENIKDQLEIMINNINKRFSNVEMESVRETSDIVILNSSKQNDGISRAQYNMEDQNKIIYNTNNEISSKNLRDGMRDDVKANTEILNSTKIQSDSLNILHISESFPSNNIQKSISPRKYLGKKCESTEISEPHIVDEEHAEVTSEFCLNIQQQDPTNERSNDSTESFGKLYIDENMEMQTQCDKMSFEENNLKSQDSIELLDTISCDSTKVTSFSFLKNTAKADLFDTYQDFKTEAQYIEELDEHQSLKIERNREKMQLQDVSLKFEDECNVRESVIQSTNIIKKHEDTTKENNELLITEEIEFQEMSSNREVSKDTLHVEKSMTESIYLKYPEDIEEEKMELNAQKLSEDIEEEKIEINAQKLPEDIKEEIDTYTIIKMDNKNREQSLLKIEEVGFQKMSSKFRNPEDISSIEDNSTESVYFQLPEAIEQETINIDTQELKYIEKKKTKMDTHSGIKAINKQLKHVSEQKYRKSRTHALNSFQRDDFLDVNEKEISAKFSATDFLDADDIEYISLKSDDSNSMPSILDIRSISPSSFEKMKNINAFLENNSESLTKNDENSLDINDNLGISDEIDDRLCLRCKRKSIVYCQACLEAHYCSKRCSSLHWNAEHYKQCKGRNAIICIDE